MPNAKTFRLKPFFISSLFPSMLLLSGCSQLDVFAFHKNKVPQADEQISLNMASQFPNCIASETDWQNFPPLPATDIWLRLREGYQLTHAHHERVERELNWYARYPDYLQRVTERSQRYMFYIMDEIERRNLPAEFALLPIVESAFDPFAYSHGRASGMWQIIPGTGKMLGLKQNWWYDGRRDIIASTDAALTYLEQLNKRFDGNWLLALAAYNSGAGNVSRAIKKNQARGKPTDFWNLDLPKETRTYVPRLLAISRLIAEPEKYNLTLHPIRNEAYFASIEVDSQIDLAQAAELAEMEMDDFYHLNPGFNRWATDPDGPHTLLVPANIAFTFEERLKNLSEEDRISWRRYKIKTGDSLSSIAKKHKVSVEALKSINLIPGSSIRAGQNLFIPVAAKDSQYYTHSKIERLNKKVAAAAKKESGTRVDYIVQNGDSLWQISKRYNVTTGKIARWNNMAARDPIYPGQKLVIWTDTPIKSLASAGGIYRKVSYVVRKGDSLYRIADKFSLEVHDIVRWNSVNTSNHLQPGQSLTLFVDVTNVTNI